MSDVTGPISTLPGSFHSLPTGAVCDLHPDRPAVARIQGETDSFGSEMIDCCAECIRQLREEAKLARVGRCDWCCTDADDLRDRRDYDEGMRGPVYRVCGGCAGRSDERLAAELDQSGWA